MLHRSDCYLLYIVVLYLSVTATCKFSTLDHLKSQASDKKQGRAVAELLRRLLGNRSAEFVVLVNRSLSNDSLDVCELRSTKNNKIVATGNSGVSVASGIYNYLKYFCNCHVSWSGDQLDLPRPLPKLSGVLRINTQHRFRYYQNVCTFSYSSVWWDWPRWEREIDWMALNGINLPLAFTGQEAIWQEVYRALGLNQSEIEEFFAGPAFLAWNRMGNMFEFGGPLPQSWHVNQLTLQVIKQFGTDHVYNTDTFNEMIPPSSDPAYLSAVSRSVFASMTAVDPQAIWLMQGWLFFSAATFWKPAQIQALLHGVPLGRMIVLDLFAETEPIFSYTESFYGQPFIWCMLQNFGGNSGLFGTVESINSGPFKALHFPNSTMVGIGMTPEGIEQNPVMYELMSELAWRKEPVNLVKWASLYAIRRYGTTQDSLITAWRLLFSSVYNCTLPHYRNHNHSPLVRRPSLHMNTDLWYNPADLFNAWKLIIEVSPSLMSKETFRYDLVDVTREVLQVLTTSFYLDITDAFHKQKLPELLISAGVLIYDLLPELNRLLCSDRNFLLGKWLEQAKSLAIDEEEAQLYDMNARNQLTLWGPSGEIQDYASKEWGGLMEDYYAQRWGLFVQTLVKCLDSGQPFKQDAFNQAVFQVEKGFIYNGRKYPTKPQGDTYEITRRIFLKYYPQALKRLL
ncbi:alpha-N-acetylglucosaminidase isoform X3 [Syngnathoides biaculeatus]|uniref:alpha-N-acetylglucosaminidase isoform X3 n=1 Tax=Syngnathoides biaculeatus TaxID=300417 RepID=UPI002ADE0A1E|nr:alpha-N-acetylglucosaminidase isoform X3 [Syngnathoides biaculeatus]